MDTRVFWATVFKPIWMLEAIIVCWKYYPNLRDSWHTADSLWDIMLEDLDLDLPMMCPRDALSIDMQYWDD